MEILNEDWVETEWESMKMCIRDRLHIMQRVAYAQPVDGKVMVLAEYFITGQRIVQIAELDKEGFPQGFVREALQHIAKDSFCLLYTSRCV